MKAMAWAVVCDSGEVHVTDDGCYVFLDRDQAMDCKNGTGFDWNSKPDNEGCGPHRVITLYRSTKGPGE